MGKIMAFKDDLLAAAAAAKVVKDDAEAARQLELTRARQDLIPQELERVRAEMVTAASSAQDFVTIGFMGILPDDPVLTAVQSFFTAELLEFDVEITPKADQANITVYWGPRK